MAFPVTGKPVPPLPDSYHVEDREKLLEQKVGLLYGHLPSGLAVNALVSLGLGLLVRSSCSLVSLGLWGIGVAAVTAFRIIDLSAFRRKAAPGADSAAWRRKFTVGSTAQGVLWGIAGFFLFPSSVPVDQLFLVVILAAMAGGAIIYLSAVMSVYVLYVIPTLLPACLRLLAVESSAARVAGALGFLYCAAMIYASSKTSQWIDGSLSTNAELERYRTHLEHLVEGRTRELTDTNARLQIEIREKDAQKQKAEQNEMQFRESKNLLRAVVEGTTDAVYVKDLQGRYLLFNAAASRFTGKSAADVIGKDDSVLFPADVARTVMEGDRGVIASGKAMLYEERVTTGEGKKATFLSTKGPMIDESGNVTGLFGIARDITERKRAEIEKEKLQSQLHQAMKMEAIGRLAGGVAHDFNNLLTVITGYSELLLQKIGQESPMHGEVEEIKGAADRAASLTQQLLAFSRKQVIEPKVVHLDKLVADMLPMLTRLIGEDIAVQIKTGKAPGSVKIDVGLFQQILMNLTVNARDAMPGGGKIVIETANVDLDEDYCSKHLYVTPGQFVMLSVSDTGIGMSEEVKSHIFEPFFTTKEKGKGTGLGLATAYGAVKQAGGSVEVHSEVGKGTIFKIYLPWVEGEAAKPVKDARPQDLQGGAETVLLVEDENVVRNLCVQILGKLGYKVLQARDGAEAIALAQKYVERVDLLLTDVVMPGMNGVELAKRLVLHHPEMKVLFMSGYTDDAIVHHGVLDEGVSFIGKPYTPSALARKVREVLGKA